MMIFQFDDTKYPIKYGTAERYNCRQLDRCSSSHQHTQMKDR